MDRALLYSFFSKKVQTSRYMIALVKRLCCAQLREVTKSSCDYFSRKVQTSRHVVRMAERLYHMQLRKVMRPL